MGAKHDQLKQELSKLSHEEVMDRAVNYAIELDREQKMRLAEKQIYKNVQQRSQKLEEQNKELENSIAVFGSLFVELLKLIHDSTTKLNACIAAYDELKIQLQHSQEVNIGLNDKVYAPSTERLDKSVKSASFKKQQDDNPAYAFRCWLLRLGFIGDDTKAARKYLLKNFSGDKAWRKAA